MDRKEAEDFYFQKTSGGDNDITVLAAVFVRCRHSIRKDRSNVRLSS